MDRRQVLALGVLPMAAPLVGVVRSATPTTGQTRSVLPGDNIQAALDAGPGRVELAPGTYTLTAPLQMRPHVWLAGAFSASTLRAGVSMSAVILVGAGGPIDRWRISDLVIDARSASTGIDVNIVGTTGNTNGEPDSQGRVENVFVDDPTQQGIWYRGADAQAIVTREVRVRRAGVHAYRIENADSWWSDCEGTTSGGTGAGFYVAGSNLHFDHCKAWYCRGYGWYIHGVRNTFTGCESQDTGTHGWRIAYDKNTLAACIADTAGMYDVGGTPGTADGFYVDPTANVTMTSCLSFDRRPGGHAAQQRYGFNISSTLANANLILACTGWDNVSGTFYKRP